MCTAVALGRCPFSGQLLGSLVVALIKLKLGEIQFNAEIRGVPVGVSRCLSYSSAFACMSVCVCVYVVVCQPCGCCDMHSRRRHLVSKCGANSKIRPSCCFHTKFETNLGHGDGDGHGDWCAVSTRVALVVSSGSGQCCRMPPVARIGQQR